MVVLNIHHTNYQKLLKDLAFTLGAPQEQEDFLLLSEPVGRGTIKVFSLFDELQVFLIDAVFTNTIMTVREKSDDQHYILHFDEINITDTSFKFMVGEEL